MGENSLDMQAPIKRTSPDTLRLERVMDASPETVWRYLTQAELRSQWFAGGTDATGEGPMELAFNHDNLSSDDVPCPKEYAGHKGAVNKEQVLRFEPYRLLAYTFGEGRNGVATFELFPEGDQTRLILTHSGIQSPSGPQDFGSGWNSHLFVLREKLAGRTVRNFWAVHAKSRELVKQALA